MNYYDHHVHTEFSPDSEVVLREYLEKGIKKIMLTDHVDIGSPDEMFEKIIDYESYSKVVKNIAEEFDAEILIGVEIGYQKEYLDEINTFVKSYPFDFVISSIHFADGLDFYNGDFFIGKTQNEAYQRYFEVLEEMVDSFNDFDVVGHFDYITRYGNFMDKRYDFKSYEEIIGRILSKLVSKGKGIEINTSGMRNDLKIFHPKKEVIQLYRSLGGEIVTLGSDAHRSVDYASDFTEAAQLLADLRFEFVCEFDKRSYTKRKISSL